MGTRASDNPENANVGGTTLSRRRFLISSVAATVGVGSLAGLAGCGTTTSQPKTNGGGKSPGKWSYGSVAKNLGLSGITLHAPFLRRPGYTAAEKLIPEFTDETGIRITWDWMPYSDLYSKQVLSFRTDNSYHLALSDCVFVGSFVTNGWVTPLKKFWSNSEITDPELQVHGPNGFFPVLLFGYGTWGNTVYGLPFDCYSHLKFYNKQYFKEAGFHSTPSTWQELRDVYAPKLTDSSKNRYAYVLQAARNETIVADALLVFVQDWGGAVIDSKTFKPTIDTPQWRDALEFMISLKKFMPPGSDTWDHDPTVQALAQGTVAMIDEWSPFYTTLTTPSSSKIVNEVGVGVEPGNQLTHLRKPAFGGFSWMINSHISTKEQQAAWLFIQWITSNKMAPRYVEAGGVPGRRAVYQDRTLLAKYPYFKPLVESWALANPVERPRFASWPAVSAILADGASAAYTQAWSVSKALHYMQSNVYRTLETAGYYSGRQPLLQ